MPTRSPDFRKGERPIHQMEELEMTVSAKVPMSQLANVVRLDRETSAPGYEGMGRLLFTCGRILYPNVLFEVRELCLAGRR